MNERVMEALDRFTKKYLKAIVKGNRSDRTWYMACISCVYAYTGDEESARFSHDVHDALLEIFYKT